MGEIRLRSVSLSPPVPAITGLRHGYTESGRCRGVTVRVMGDGIGAVGTGMMQSPGKLRPFDRSARPGTARISRATNGYRFGGVGETGDRCSFGWRATPLRSHRRVRVLVERGWLISVALSAASPVERTYTDLERIKITLSRKSSVWSVNSSHWRQKRLHLHTLSDRIVDHSGWLDELFWWAPRWGCPDSGPTLPRGGASPESLVRRNEFDHGAGE